MRLYADHVTLAQREPNITSKYGSKKIQIVSLGYVPLTVMEADLKEVFFTAKLLMLLFSVVLGQQGMAICENQWEVHYAQDITTTSTSLYPQLAQEK